MEPRFRNRIIGVITLVLLIIIFLPILFQKKDKYVEPSVPLIVNEQAETEEEFYPSDTFTALESEDNSRNYQHNDTVQVDEQHYLIQLVALKNARRIESLVALLILNNYSVLTKPEKPREGQMNILYVGPYASKEEANADLATLKDLTKLSGKIIIDNNKK